MLVVVITVVVLAKEPRGQQFVVGRGGASTVWSVVVERTATVFLSRSVTTHVARSALGAYARDSQSRTNIANKHIRTNSEIVYMCGTAYSH